MAVNPEIIDFAKTSTNKVAPTAFLQDKGWANEEIPSSANMNYLMSSLYKALKFLLIKGGFQYDANTPYEKGSLTIKDGRVFNSKVTNPTAVPSFGSPEWEQISRDVTVSHVDPTPADGQNGDIWIVY